MSSPNKTPNISLQKPSLQSEDSFSEDNIPSALDTALNGSPPAAISHKIPNSSSVPYPPEFHTVPLSQPHASPGSPRASQKWRAFVSAFWQKNRGLVLVTLSQLFGALMNVFVRVLERDEHGMGLFQLLFTRAVTTVVLSCVYMWWAKVPGFPLGEKRVRWLLVGRGVFGFFGVFGLYYSLLYLPIAEATVMGFLAPGVASIACYILIREPYTRTEQIATLVSLIGVIFIARPTSFFHFLSPSDPDASVYTNSTIAASTSNTTISSEVLDTPTPAQRLSAVGVSLLGVLGSAGAFTTIRWIGHRAHPLLSVNYFSATCTVVSALVLTVGSSSGHTSPSSTVTWSGAMPPNPRAWFLVIALGICGFVMQFLLTAGLAHERSNRTQNMVYTNMLFALLFDKVVFGTTPGGLSILGSGLILGSAVWVAVKKAGDGEKEVVGDVETARVGQERATLMGDVDGVECGGEEVVQMRDLTTQ